jgi:uncharacterized protein YjaZ
MSVLVVLLLILSDAMAEITVVAIYEGQLSYLNAVRSSDNPDLRALAQHHVVEPYLDACTRGMGEESRAAHESTLAREVTDIEELYTSAEKLKRRDTARRMAEYLGQAAELLPRHDDIPLTVCIEASHPPSEPDIPFVRDVAKGVGGQYFGNGALWLSIQPYPGWFEHMKYVVAHEYHHYIREPEPETLLDGLIIEGLADAFAREVYNGWAPAAFAQMDFDSDQELMLWQKIKPHLLSTDQDTIMRFKFGSVYGAEDLPPAMGYVFGRYIVDTYLETYPDVPLVEWTHFSAADIFADSGYDGSRLNLENVISDK